MHHIERIDPRATRRDQIALGVDDIVLGDDRGIEQPLALGDRRGHPIDPLGPPDARHGLFLHLALQPLDPAIRFKGPEFGLDRREQIGLDDRESLAHLAIVSGPDCRDQRPAYQQSGTCRGGQDGYSDHSSESPVPMMRAEQTKPMSA